MPGIKRLETTDVAIVRLVCLTTQGTVGHFKVLGLVRPYCFSKVTSKYFQKSDLPRIDYMNGLLAQK